MAGLGFGEIAERLRRSTVRVDSASGLIVAADGGIVTNAHVARRSRAHVELWDGRVLPARLMARDSRRDLAKLQVEASDLPAASFRDSGDLRVGELVIAVGNPLGFSGALTTGIVHSLGPLRGLGAQAWVRANVRLAPGNSGGPMADAQGRVIGINTMIAGGLGLAVPSNAVRSFLQQGGAGYALGVTVRPIAGRWNGAAAVGLLVLEVAPRSPAAISSLMPGDLLVAVDGKTFTAPDDLLSALDGSRPLLRLQFFRGDRERVRETTVRLDTPVPEAA